MSTRCTYVMRDGKLVPKHLAAPLHAVLGRGPMLIRDDMDYTLNPADGRRYTSKAAYERAVTRAGCAVVGNEDLSRHVGAKPEPSAADVVSDIKRSIAELESR